MRYTKGIATLCPEASAPERRTPPAASDHSPLHGRHDRSTSTAPLDRRAVRRRRAAPHAIVSWLATRRLLFHQRRRLAREPLFAACTHRELMTLLPWGDEIELPAGVTVWRQNTIGNCVLVVLAGELRMSRGRRHVGTVLPGEWTGEVAVLGFGPQPATVTTQTDCRLFVLGARA